MKRKTNQIGTITLGDRVHVSDPCYETDCWCAGTLDNVVPGRYNCKIVRCHDDCCTKSTRGYFERVKALIICHEDYIAKAKERVSIDVGVDSGQAGFYDLSYYQRLHPAGKKHLNREWYDRVCDITIRRLPNSNFMKCKDYMQKELGSRYMDWCALSKAKFRGELSEEAFSALWEEHVQVELRYMEEPDIQWPTYEVGYAGILDDQCVVSSSGYGDGGYDCYVGRNAAGQIVSARIQFI